jgi:hypothetical protein
MATDSNLLSSKDGTLCKQIYIYIYIYSLSRGHLLQDEGHKKKLSLRPSNDMLQLHHYVHVASLPCEQHSWLMNVKLYYCKSKIQCGPLTIGEILSGKKWRNNKSKIQCGPLSIEEISSGKKWRK